MKEKTEVFARIPIEKWKMVVALNRQGDLLEAAEQGKEYFNNYLQSIIIEYKTEGLEPEKFDELKSVNLSKLGFKEMLKAGMLWPVCNCFGNNRYREVNKTELKHLIKEYYNTLKTMSSEDQKIYISNHKEETEICLYQEMIKVAESNLAQVKRRIKF